MILCGFCRAIAQDIHRTIANEHNALVPLIAVLHFPGMAAEE
jgi:hypothetical protein